LTPSKRAGTLAAGMKHFVSRTLLLGAVLAASMAFASTAFATEFAPAASQAAVVAQAAESDQDVVPMAIWSIVGVLIFGFVLGVLYLFKRRIGAFPKDPEWVAPISIERSATFAKEGDFGDVAHDSHGSHH
jgi:protein-S-isoprenylcysteine O-methyltransferase Ste14